MGMPGDLFILTKQVPKPLGSLGVGTLGLVIKSLEIAPHSYWYQALIDGIITTVYPDELQIIECVAWVDKETV